MEESISLEETNLIRISLGLKPLTDDKNPVNDKDKEAEDNYARQREKEVKERETKKIQDRIAKVRNRRELNALLKGATLGDADGDVDDTLKWIRRSKKKEKELAKKRQEEFESMDKAVEQEYTERDLEGLKVSHDFDGMEEGEARILTLKDSRILDNEEDELHNVEMAEEERRKKNQELKIKRRDYTGYDDDEFNEDNQGVMKRSILAKYDEDIEGTQHTEFRLGASIISGKAKREEDKHEAAAAVNKLLLSLDYAKNLEINDYIKEGDVGFKKPKTKKKRPSRRTSAGVVDDMEGKMEIDQNPAPIARNLNANFVDDDELQAALARSRRAKLHKAKKVSPEELAKKVAEQRVQEEAETEARAQVEENGADDENRLVFDDTSEFVRAVGNNPIIKPKAEPKEVGVPEPPSPSAQDIPMAPGDVAMGELEEGEVRVKDEEDDIDIDMIDALEDAIKLEEAAQILKKEEDDSSLGVGTSSEQNFSSGMAATLNILRHQGVLAPPSADQMEREKTQKQRDLWLAEQRFRIAKRELERLQSRGGNRDQAQREYDNRLRELQERRENTDSFNTGYKPDVNIVYYDDYGRQLTVKEAWKALSHKFHGKGSGKMKTEKRLKKIAEEKKKEAMASGDTPLSMNKAFQQRQEKAGQAHFVLSVGNRGAVPQASEFLDSQPLAKGKTEKTKKKKEGKNVQQNPDAGFMIVPAPSIQTLSNGGTPTPLPNNSASGSPAPRAGFSRIASALDTPSQSQGGTPVPADRAKVTFGLGVKRKAGEEAYGSPASKRR